ncbi:MAG: MFS transporter, partial [Thermoanaerobaculia bacterium]
FFLSSFLTFLMIFPSIFLYKEPKKEIKQKPLSMVLKEIFLVLKDFKFVGLIFIYSVGFWVLYFQMYDSVLWYFKDYINMEPVNKFINKIININFQFNEAHITVLNAFTIILLQIFVSKITSRFKALPTMAAGIFIAIFGMFLFGFFHSPYTFILGIFIFSIGEMVAHPKFISYISIISPEDKKALYMGYLFLYGVIGSSIGGILAGFSYHFFVEKLNSPRALWLFFCSIGFVSIIGLLIFNKLILKKK